MRHTTRNRSIAALVLVLGAGGAWLHLAQGAAQTREPKAALSQPQPIAPPTGSTAAVAAPSAPQLPPPLVPPALDESSLMAELRRVKDSDPELVLTLARDGNQRFPDSPDAPERAASIVYALSALGRSSESRGAAEDMVNRYPDSHWVQEVERFTGAHRHRNVRTNADGQLEYY